MRFCLENKKKKSFFARLVVWVGAYLITSLVLRVEIEVKSSFFFWPDLIKNKKRQNASRILTKGFVPYTEKKTRFVP